MRPPYPHPMATKEPVIISAHFAHSTEADLVKRAAKAVGMTPSTFLRELALKEANRIAGLWLRPGVGKRPKLEVIKGGKR
jgi:hypothetical protein